MENLNKTFLVRLSQSDLDKLHLLADHSDCTGCSDFIRQLLAHAWKEAPAAVRLLIKQKEDFRQLHLWQ